MRVRWKEERRQGATGETFRSLARGLKQRCSTSYAKPSWTTGADGPIRVSVILANRSGVPPAGRFSLEDVPTWLSALIAATFIRRAIRKLAAYAAEGQAAGDTPPRAL